MKIIDLNGTAIEVTDLNKALKQAKMFKDFRHVDRSYVVLDKKLRKYWSDMYGKLLILKNKAGKLPPRKQRTGTGGAAAC